MRKNQVDADSPSVNASSMKETVAKGGNTHGILNQHPTTTESSSTTAQPSSSSSSTTAAKTAPSKSKTPLFRIGVSIDRNKRWRRTMEDAHAFVYGYGGVQGQGFFSVFDGHAGKHAAEWCGKNFHQQLLESLSTHPELPVPDVFAHAFHTVDEKLRISAEENNTSSGCTAVVAFLRLEDSDGNPMSGKGTGGVIHSVGKSGGDHNRGSVVAIGGIAAGEGGEEEESKSNQSQEKRKSSLKDLIIGPGRPTSPNSKDKDNARDSSGGNSAGNTKEGIFSSFARRVRQASGHERGHSNSSQSIPTTIGDSPNTSAAIATSSTAVDQNSSIHTTTSKEDEKENTQSSTMISKDQAPSGSPSVIPSEVITPSKASENPQSQSSSGPSTSQNQSQSSDLSSSTSRPTDSDPADSSTNKEKLEEGENGEEEQETQADISRSSILTATSTGTGGEDSLLDVYKNHENPESIRRVLYTANVGDARAVLCRSGKAVRLSYDHKGSDPQEVKRITDSGGFVMNNRVNGVLAVTRSLGDSAMKEFVVGSPYTTETTIGKEDSFLIVACDGLWDVADDQDAVDLIMEIKDAQEASEKLLQHALSNFSTDNTSVMVIRLDQ